MFTSRCALFLVGVVVVAGCTPSRIDVRPVAQRMVVEGDRLAALFQVPRGGPGGLDVVVTSAGVRQVPGEVAIDFEVALDVTNRSETQLAQFDEAACALVDQVGFKVPAVGPASGAGPSGDTTGTVIRPGERRIFGIRFKSDRGDDPRALTPCVVTIAFAYGGRAYTIRVPFARLEYTHRSDWYYDPRNGTTAVQGFVAR